MNNLKIDIIKSLMMIESEKELNVIRQCLSDSICRECDQDTVDKAEFKKWKESKKEENDDEIPF